jgi:hypothetical protein
MIFPSVDNNSCKSRLEVVFIGSERTLPTSTHPPTLAIDNNDYASTLSNKPSTSCAVPEPGLAAIPAMPDSRRFGMPSIEAKKTTIRCSYQTSHANEVRGSSKGERDGTKRQIAKRGETKRDRIGVPKVDFQGCGA